MEEPIIAVKIKKVKKLTFKQKVRRTLKKITKFLNKRLAKLIARKIKRVRPVIKNFVWRKF